MSSFLLSGPRVMSAVSLAPQRLGGSVEDLNSHVGYARTLCNIQDGGCSVSHPEMDGQRPSLY